MASTKIEDFRRNCGELATISAVLVDVSSESGSNARSGALFDRRINREGIHLPVHHCP